VSSELGHFCLCIVEVMPSTSDSGLTLHSTVQRGIHMQSQPRLEELFCASIRTTEVLCDYVADLEADKSKVRR
jgi:hypothetical protein